MNTMIDYTITTNDTMWYFVDEYDYDPGSECVIIHNIDGVSYWEIQYIDDDHNTYELNPITHGPQPCD